MMLTFLYAAVFVGVLIAAESVLRGYFRSSERVNTVNHRMRMLEGSQDFRKTYSDMLKERGADGAWGNLPFMQSIRQFYVQSGIKFNPVQFSIRGLIGAVVIWLIVQFMIDNALLRLAVFVAICLVAPIVVVWRVRSARIRKFSLKLPEALDVATRSLSAGHPLSAAIVLVSKELPDPIGSEFGLLSDELTYGVTLDQALKNLYDRVGVDDLNLLAIALSVQAGTGGNLVEILENLSKALRERSMLKAKVKSITSEGRITGIFMSAYPVLLFLMINTISPTYFDSVWESGYANTVIGVILAVMAVGNFILYKLVHFEF